MPTIELSAELYRALQSLAVPFEDKSPEDAIWRLIRERQMPDTSASPARLAPLPGPGLMSAGVLIPEGLKLRFNYKGRLLPAEVRDSRIWIGDRAFSSPSSSAVAAAATLGSPSRSLNGWWYWEYEDKGTWRRLAQLRKAGQTRRRKR